MEELKKLIQIVQRRGATDAFLLDFKNKKPHKEWLLFEGLTEGRITGNQDAQALLYKGKPSANGVNMLKYRLKRKLFNQLFFSNQRRFKLQK